MKLATKMVSWFFLITCVLVFIVGYLAFRQGKTALENAAVNHLVSSNLYKKALFEGWVQSNAHFLTALAKSQFLKNEFQVQLTAFEAAKGRPDPGLHSRLASYFKPMIEIGEFFEYFILDADDGWVLFSSDSAHQGRFLDDRQYFIKGKSGTYVQSAYYSTSLQRTAMTISTPITDSDDRVIAVLAGRLNFNTLSTIMAAPNVNSPSEDSYLVNLFHFFVTEPRFGKGYAFKQTAYTEGVRNVLVQKNGVGLYEDYRGVPVVGAYQWLTEFELGLVTEVDQQEVFAPVYQLRRMIFIIALSMIVVSGLLGWVSAAQLVKPLRRLVVAADAIGAGQFETKIETAGKNEIAELARAIDVMVKRLTETMVSRDALQREIEHRQRAEVIREQTLAELQRSNEELQQFAYVASHDLQEPLRMVASFTQLLAAQYNDLLNEKARKYIFYAVDGARRMQELINDLLAYSRVGSQGAEPTLLNTHSALGRALTNLAAVITETGAVVTNGDLPSVMADGVQIVQVFQNLIGNAIKFRTDRVPAIHVWAEKNGAEWVFALRDNGIGIEERFKDRIFVIFQRLHSHSEYPGTGIGLALCRRIIERHGGRIWFESQPGVGSTFYFSLPDKEEEVTK